MVLRGVAQLGRALGSGPRGRWFESSRPDQNKVPRVRIVPGVPKGRARETGPFVFCRAHFLIAAACTDPPSPQPSTQTVPTPSLSSNRRPPAKRSRAPMRCSKISGREAAQAKFDRQNPPPRVIPIPRSLVAAAQTDAASNASTTSPTGGSTDANDAQAEYKERAAAVATAARRATERLRDEARRADVPPGWLR